MSREHNGLDKENSIIILGYLSESGFYDNDIILYHTVYTVIPSCSLPKRSMPYMTAQRTGVQRLIYCINA